MEAVVAYFEVLSRHLPGDSEQNHEKITVRTVGVQPKIQTRHLPNAASKRYYLNQTNTEKRTHTHTNT
jgi:hypothetical protein